MKNTRRISLNVALPIAERVMGALSQHFDNVNLCGSIRRLLPLIGDIDIVVVGDINEQKISSVLMRCFDEVIPDESNTPERHRVCHHVNVEGINVDIDVWMMPEQFIGSAIMYATGSGLFNLVLRRWARHQGLMLDLYGVHRGDDVIASKTEVECFSALDLKYIEPCDRHEGKLDNILKIMNDKDRT